MKDKKKKKILKDSLISTILWTSYPKSAWSGHAPQELKSFAPRANTDFLCGPGQVT